MDDNVNTRGHNRLLLETALASAAEGITISDAKRKDNPIIYANSGFERLTGYGNADILGKNCRFLQGSGTDHGTVDVIGRSIRNGEACTVEILNYKRDGTPFWNRLSITPVRGDSGDVTHFIGVQSDITKPKQVEEELLQAKSRLERAYRHLKQDVEAAAKIQQSMLPRDLPPLEGLQFAWDFKPCTDLAGDFLNVIPLDGRHVAFYVLDVSGHGVASALLSVTLGRRLSSNPNQSLLMKRNPQSTWNGSIRSPSEVAELLNRELLTDKENGQYFTMFYALLDRENLELRYVSAGHPSALYQPKGQPFRLLPSTGAPIGLLGDLSHEEVVLKLNPGDRFLLYTDGLTELEDPHERAFGQDNLIQAAERYRALPVEDSVRNLMSDLDAWRAGRSTSDDISLLGIDLVAAPVLTCPLPRSAF